MILAPHGRWWLAYDDGAVWPCEVLDVGIFPGYWAVRPVAPAPDAGEIRYEPSRRIFDSALNFPSTPDPVTHNRLEST